MLMRHTKSINHKKFVLPSLCKGERLPSLQVIELIKKWIVRPYGLNKLQQTVDTISKLRWYLFSKFENDMSNPPPIVAASNLKIIRSPFIAFVLRRACWNFQQLPSFENYGWEFSQNKIVAIMADELPDPLALVELSVCNCTILCKNNHYKCAIGLFVKTKMKVKIINFNEYDSAEEDFQ